MSEVMEIVRFQFVEVVDAAQAAAEVEVWLAALPGVLSRVLLGPDPEGNYTNLVRCGTAAEADAAMAAMAQSAVAMAFRARIDPASVQVSRVPVVAG